MRNGDGAKTTRDVQTTRDVASTQFYQSSNNIQSSQNIMNDNQNTNEEQGDAYHEYTAGPAVETTPSAVGGGVYVLPQQVYQFVQTQTQ